MTIKSVAVYCASSSNIEDVYKEAARETGVLLAKSGYNIVYGGGHVGLMGIAADAALDGGAYVTGVITEQLQALEVAHQGLSELHIVDTMQERQKMMADLADAFVILPGGIGTLAEFFEVLTWQQLNIHEKPIIVANINNYWDGLLEMIRHTHKKGFLRQNPDDLFLVCEKISEIPEILKKIPVKG